MTNPAESQIVVVLNNVRSNENVGSIFRTCDAAGVSKIFLCGYTPAPLDRFGRQNKALTKASLGAEKFVEWERTESLEEAVNVLKNYSPSLCTDKSLLAFSSARPVGLRKARSEDNFSKFKIIGVEQDKRSINYKLIFNLPAGEAGDYNLALVFGNEVDGLSKEDLALCDVVAEIPMRGNKESLNVAVSVGIILFSIQ
jgi:tRNA G18 (ribose-2'-O)-methylase SpoU